MNKKVKEPIKIGHYPMYFDYVPLNEIERYGKKYGLDVSNPIAPSAKATLLCWTDTQPYKGNPICLVVMNDEIVKDHITVPTYFTHEGYHILCRLWEYIGESKPGEENSAYALDHIVNQLLLRYEEYHNEE